MFTCILFILSLGPDGQNSDARWIAKGKPMDLFYLDLQSLNYLLISSLWSSIISFVDNQTISIWIWTWFNFVNEPMK